MKKIRAKNIIANHCGKGFLGKGRVTNEILHFRYDACRNVFDVGCRCCFDHHGSIGGGDMNAIGPNISTHPGGLLFVGQAPNKEGGRDAMAGGAAFRRFGSVMGLDADEWLWFVRRINLLNRYPGKEGKGDMFPMDEAKRAVRRIFPCLERTAVLLVGRNVAQAANVTGDYLSWRPLDFGVKNACAILPHPSGINTWWNDRNNVRELDAFLYRTAVSFKLRSY
jgi:hypothetical protein